MKPSRPYLLRALHEWLLDNDCTPHLAVDTSVNGVMVPEQFIADNQIVLNISPSAVQGLFIYNDAVNFNARFGGVPMNVYVPVAAVMAIYAKENGMGMGFGIEPGNEFYDLEPEAEAQGVEEPESKEKPSRPTLRVVK